MGEKAPEKGMVLNLSQYTEHWRFCVNWAAAIKIKHNRKAFSI